MSTLLLYGFKLEIIILSFCKMSTTLSSTSDDVIIMCVILTSETHVRDEVSNQTVNICFLNKSEITPSMWNFFVLLFLKHKKQNVRHFTEKKLYLPPNSKQLHNIPNKISICVFIHYFVLPRY